MNFPKELHYTKTHEWARRQGKVVSVGITDYAQKEISDVVFVELPKAGTEVRAGKPICVVESVKAAFDIYAPVSGRVGRVNSDLETDPAHVNKDCYGSGWFFELEPSDPKEWDALMTAEAYENHIRSTVK